MSKTQEGARVPGGPSGWPFKLFTLLSYQLEGFSRFQRREESWHSVDFWLPETELSLYVLQCQSITGRMDVV